MVFILTVPSSSELGEPNGVSANAQRTVTMPALPEDKKSPAASDEPQPGIYIN